MNTIRSFFSKNRYEVFFIVITLGFTLLTYFETGAQLTNKIFLSNTLDFSWTSDSIERLLHGYIAGRDFIFTYGPLFQLVQSIPSLVFHYPSYASPLISSILLQIPLCLFIYILSHHVTQSKKDALLLFVIVLSAITSTPSLDASNLLRILFPFIYAVMYLKTYQAKSLYTLKSAWLLFMPTLGGLYSFDLFIICVSFMIMITVYDFFITRKKQVVKNKNLALHHIKLLAIQLMVIVIFEVITSLLLSHSLQYLYSSFDTLRAYQYIMNIPFSLSKSWSMSIFFISNCLLGWYILFRTHCSKDQRRSLTAFFLIALIQLKAGLIRSDDAHIFIAFYPSFIVSIVFLFVLLEKRLHTLLIAISCLLIVIISVLTTYPSLLSSASTKGLAKLANTSISFSELYVLPKNYYYTPTELQAIQHTILKNQDSTMIYPYDTYLLNSAHTTFPTYALQFYQYSASPVEQISVERLDKNPPKYIILGIDTKTALALDDIPNFTRNPLLTKWMLENYSVSENKKTYLVLILDKQKKNRVERNNETSCDIYEFNTHLVMNSSLLENTVKTATYYLSTPHTKLIRLPYSPYSQSIFMIPHSSNADSVATLFSKPWDFEKGFSITRKQLTIIKKSPIPTLKEKITTAVETRCYQ